MIERVTLRDIAAAVGVHYSTVSLALRDHPRISSSVRRKIKQTAARMGYAPDPALSALNAYRKTKLPVHYQSNIAWIDNWKGPARMRDQPTFNEYFEGAAVRARQLGYELEEFRLEEQNVSTERASRVLQSRGIKGLLLAPRPTSGMRLPLNYEWFSTIAFGYSIEPRVFHLVTNHQFHSMLLALRELTSLGYRKIGLFLHGDDDDKVDNAYSTAYWHFFQRLGGVGFTEPCVVRRGEAIQESFLEWFENFRPDAVASVGGFAVVDWLGQIGLKVPRDVGYVRLSVRRDEEYFSGIYENGLLIGQIAVDFLVGMLQRGENGFPKTPIRILVEGDWKSGKTVRQQEEKPAGRRGARARPVAKSVRAEGSAISEKPFASKHCIRKG